MIKRSKLLSIQLLLAGLGMLLSMYTIYIYVTSNSTFCTTSCESVITGEYGEFLGQSWGFWGLLFYLGLAVILILRIKKVTKILDVEVPLSMDLVFKIGLIAGWVVTFYLRYLEFFVLYKTCFWCWMSVVILLLLTVVEIILHKQPRVE